MRNAKLKYKGFIGDAQFSKYENHFYGSVLNTNDLVTYEGDTLNKLTEEFKISVDTYIDMCAEIGFFKILDPKLFNKSKFYILIKIIQKTFTLQHLKEINFTNIGKIFVNKKSSCLVNYDKKKKKYLGLVKYQNKWYTISSKTLGGLNNKFKEFISTRKSNKLSRKYITLR